MSPLSVEFHLLCRGWYTRKYYDYDSLIHWVWVLCWGTFLSLISVEEEIDVYKVPLFHHSKTTSQPRHLRKHSNYFRFHSFIIHVRSEQKKKWNRVNEREPFSFIALTADLREIHKMIESKRANDWIFFLRNDKKIVVIEFSWLPITNEQCSILFAFNCTGFFFCWYNCDCWSKTP